MRCALFLSLIAAARAFAPPSILRASVVGKNEADAASTVPESHGRISNARRAVMPRALRLASTLSLRTKRLAGALNCMHAHAFGTSTDKSAPAETRQPP